MPDEFLRPDADDTLDGWTDQDDGTTNIFVALDEATALDDDFVQSPVIDAAQADLVVRLIEGASTEIAEWPHTDIADTFTDAEQTLTTPEFEAITDFTDLSIELDDNAGSVYRFSLGDAGGALTEPVMVRYRYKKLVVEEEGSTLLTDLVSFWELEETSGTRVDAHGSNDLTDNNTVTQTTGMVGNCAVFTAANSETLSRASNSTLQVGGQDYSIAGWFYRSSFSLGYFISKGGSFGNREYRIGIEFTSGFRVVFAVVDNGGASARSLYADTFGNTSTATWYFFAATFNAATSQMSISVNAGTPDTFTLPAPPTTNSTGDFVIGAFEGADFWDGRIDQIGFWKKVLTPTEITQLYNGGAGLAYSEL